MPPTEFNDNKLITKDVAPSANQPMIKTPSPKAQSWGTIVSLVIIVLMIVVGALYAWGKRIAEENALQEQLQAEQV